MALAILAGGGARARIDRLLTSVASEADALARPALQAMLPVLKEAEHELRRDLQHWLSKVDGAERYTTFQHRNAMMQIRQALNHIQKTEPAMFNALVTADRKAAPMAVRHVREELATFADHFGTELRPIRLDLAATVADGDKILMRRFKTSAERYAGDVGAHIRQQMAVGIVKGESVDEIMRRLIVKRFKAPAANAVAGSIEGTAKLASEAMMHNPKWWAERLVRTETINAYNVRAESAVAQVHRIDPEIQRMWNAALDSRVCPICRELDGAIAEVGKDFRGGYSHAPAHPCCRCIVTAWRSDWAMDSPQQMAA